MFPLESLGISVFDLLAYVRAGTRRLKITDGGVLYTSVWLERGVGGKFRIRRLRSKKGHICC